MADTVPYETVWETLGLEETQLLGFNETIVARDGEALDGVSGTLPILSVDDGSHAEKPEAGSHFRVQTLLGRGGMGIVHLATQRALGREVALKTVLGERRVAAVDETLLQEARIMGLVEHPNVVPVHIIGRDEDGRPIIVMKRIEGRSWDSALQASSAEDRVRSSPDVSASDVGGLPLHLDVILKVGQALSYAHSRGILHRDVKPANVMIGSFGEVYLLDWGLAVSLPGFDRPMIPGIETADQVVGTPAYIAPEMTVGQPDGLGVHTDVYLLGAVLYEVITGRPPHTGKTLFDLMRSSYEGHERSYPDWVPAELAEICECAMARAPEERYASVQAFLTAIEEFREHRTSYRLADEAMEGLARLKAHLQREDPDEGECYRLFGAVRFGFEQALSIWAGNTDARRGLREVLETVARYELGRRNLRTAEVLVADIRSPAEDIVAGLEALRREVAEEAAELQRLRDIYDDYDPSVGLRIKAKAIALMGVGFTFVGLVPLVMKLYGVAPGTGLYLGSAALFLPVMLGATAVGWETFAQTSANRTLLIALWAMYLTGSFIRVTTVAAGLAMSYSIAFELIVFSLGAVLLTMALYRRMIIPAVVFGVAALLSAVIPEWAFPVYGLAGGFACFGFAAAARYGS